MLFTNVVLYTKHLLIVIWTCLLELFRFMTMYYSILSMLGIPYHIRNNRLSLAIWIDDVTYGRS